MKFDMGLAWNEAMAMVSANREVMITVAGLFFFLPSLLISMMMPDTTALFAGASEAEMAQVLEQVGAIYADYWWLLAISTLGSIIGYLALLSLLRDHAKPTVAEAIVFGFKALLPALATYVLYILIIALVAGVLIGLAGASGIAALTFGAALFAMTAILYISIKFTLSGAVLAIDKVFNPVAVLSQSWRMTKGNSFRIFLFILMIMIVYVVISSVLSIIALALTAVMGGEAGRIVQGVLTGLVGTAVTIIMVAVIAAIHRQLSGPSAAAASKVFD